MKKQIWPFVLLVPAAIVHLLHGTLVQLQPRGTLWLSAGHAGVSFLSSFLFIAAFEEPGWRGSPSRPRKTPGGGGTPYLLSSRLAPLEAK